MKFPRPFILLTLLAICGFANPALQSNSQSQSAPKPVLSSEGATTRPEFEITSVKVNKSGGGNENIRIGREGSSRKI